jgi:hypothetical protein
VADKLRAHWLTWLVIAALLSFFCAGVRDATMQGADWAGTGTGAPDPDVTLAVDNILSAGKTADGRIEPNFRPQVAWFRASDGHIVSLWVLGSSFGEQRIDGWKPSEAGSTLLVDSVDENQTISKGTTSGINGPIGRGCDLTRYEGQALPAGSVFFHPCQGPYRANSGISDVASIAVITYQADNKVKRPSCLTGYDGTDEQKYRACISDSINSGLARVLRHRDRSGARYANLILPAIGTGHGPLDKADFYKLFFGGFATTLKSEHQGANLPSNIYLQVSPEDVDDSFARVMDGVRNGVEASVTEWNDEARSRPSTEWLRGAGIAGGLAVLMIAVLLSKNIAGRLPELDALLRQPSPLKMLAWIVVCFGLTEGVSKLIPPIEQLDSYLQLALGFIIVPFSSTLAKALGKVDATMKDAITIDDPSDSKEQTNPR